MAADPGRVLARLIEARKIALGDAEHYRTVVPGVLPVIGPGESLELQRWGADFLAETFASPVLAYEDKQWLSIEALKTLKEYLEAPGGQDAAVVKSVVQAVTSIYPLVFKHVIYNPSDVQVWQRISAIKSNILRRMDSSPSGVKLCCIKFIQRVVQVQTQGLIADPRRPDQNETSLTLVPRDHPLITPQNLEAEAFGLLDRLLNVFQENQRYYAPNTHLAYQNVDYESDALQVTATLNSIGILVRTRPSVANRILNVILNFNPFNVDASSITPRLKIEVKSMERTLRAFLANLNKRNPNHPSAGRIQGHLDKLQQVGIEVLDDGRGRKRPAPSEPTDGLDANKRQRLDADGTNTPPQSSAYPPLPEGPISFAQLFALTQDEGAKSFDVQALPIDLINRIIVPILSTIDQQQLDSAINAVRGRYLRISQPRQTSPMAVPSATEGSDDSIDVEAAISTLESQGLDAFRPPDVALGPFVIPQPPPLTDAEVEEYGKGTVSRVLGMMASTDDTGANKDTKPGFNRLAAAGNDRDAWITIVTRLATRSLAGLENGADGPRRTLSIADNIRDALVNYVLSDFRRRIDVAIAWLNEEWYNEQIQLRQGDKPQVQYQKWALKVLDGMVPFLDAKDKVLIRFLSEIPAIDTSVLERVKRLASDPERVQLATNALHYLALFRPPVRAICIDALEDLWRNYEDAKAAARKLLQKWRPQVLSSEEGNAMDSKSPLPSSTATAA